MTYSEFKKMAQQTAAAPKKLDIAGAIDNKSEILNKVPGGNVIGTLGKALAPFQNFSLKGTPVQSQPAPNQTPAPAAKPQQPAQPNTPQNTGSEEGAQKPQGTKKVTTEQIDPETGNKTTTVKTTEPSGQTQQQPQGAAASQPQTQQQGQQPQQTANQTENQNAGQPAQGQQQPQQGLTPEQRQQYEKEIAAFEAYLKNNPEVANAGIESNPSAHLDLGANGAKDMAGYKANVTKGMGEAIFADANRGAILDQSLRAAATVNGQFDQNKYTELKAQAYRLMMGAYNSKDPKVQEAIYGELTQLLGKSNVLSSYLASDANWKMFIGKIEESDPMFTRWMIDMQNSFENGQSSNADANSLKPFWDSLGEDRQKELIAACKKSMWNSLKSDPFKNLPTIISLWLRNKGWEGVADYAEDPLKFYLTALGTLAGGALLVGGGAAAASNAMGHPIINVGGSSNPYYNNEI